VLMPFLTLFMPYIGVNQAFMMIGSTTNRWAAESSPGHRAKKRGLLAFLRRVWYILHESPWAYPYDIWLMIWHILHHVCVCCCWCVCVVTIAVAAVVVVVRGGACGFCPVFCFDR
jgi:hypothetical protein